MIKTKDVDGRDVRGVFRGPNGSLVVQDDQLYSKYIAERDARIAQQSKVASLEAELAELKAMVKMLANTK
jgi:hypothetical protein